jgi:hypothetical protein
MAGNGVVGGIQLMDEEGEELDAGKEGEEAEYGDDACDACRCVVLLQRINNLAGSVRAGLA